MHVGLNEHINDDITIVMYVLNSFERTKYETYSDTTIAPSIISPWMDTEEQLVTWVAKLALLKAGVHKVRDRFSRS